MQIQYRASDAKRSVPLFEKNVCNVALFHLTTSFAVLRKRNVYTMTLHFMEANERNYLQNIFPNLILAETGIIFCVAVRIRAIDCASFAYPVISRVCAPETIWVTSLSQLNYLSYRNTKEIGHLLLSR